MLFYSSGVPQVQRAPRKPLGERFPQASDGGPARDKAAEMVGASPAYVQQAKQIERDAPELWDEGSQGRLNSSQAKRVAPRQAACIPCRKGKARERYKKGLCRKVYGLYHILKCPSIKNTT